MYTDQTASYVPVLLHEIARLYDNNYETNLFCHGVASMFFSPYFVTYNLSAGIDFSCQILTSKVYPRTEILNL